MIIGRPSDLFPGYTEVEAAPGDEIRRKWAAARRGAFDCRVAPVALGAGPVASLNLTINRAIRYQHEEAGRDQWQTPGDTWDNRAGDCEDYAILKYAVLLKSGLPEAMMRLVIGQIKRMPNNLDHAWLAARLDGAWRVLDNLFDHLIPPADYINWLPLAACWSTEAVRFGRSFVINDWPLGDKG